MPKGRIGQGRIAGEEGDLKERASAAAFTGSWATSTGSMNTLINNLAQPTIEVAGQLAGTPVCALLGRTYPSAGELPKEALGSSDTLSYDLVRGLKGVGETHVPRGVSVGEVIGEVKGDLRGTGGPEEARR